MGKAKEKLAKITYHLPFGCLYYFHKEQSELMRICKRLESEGNPEEAQEFYDRYNKMSSYMVNGAAISIVPGFVYAAANPSNESLALFVANIMAAHNYGELIAGKIIRKWINEHDSRGRPSKTEAFLLPQS